MGNPIWQRYVALQMPKWLEWIANNSIISHVEMAQRFIVSHPYYIPNTNSDDKINEILDKLIMDRKFIDSLSDKGAKVWYYSNFNDFLTALRPFVDHYPELKPLVRLFERYLWWFERTYAYLREELAEHLKSQGRTFK